MGSPGLLEQFPALAAIPEVGHGFVTRVPRLDVRQDKAEALRRLDAIHRELRMDAGVGSMPFITAEQVHGNGIHIVAEQPAGDRCVPACDGLISDQPGVCLGIYVADCCAVYIVDPVRRCGALLHSGKKGTELGIAPRAIQEMKEAFGSRPEELIIQLSPCIRPPHYEVDFAAEIVRACRELGVRDVHDAGVCTACDLDRYYSYRAEKGKTGRMLAWLALV